MKIIVKKANRMEKSDFPNSVVTLQLDKNYMVLSQHDIEEIIYKLIMFSEQKQTDKFKLKN